MLKGTDKDSTPARLHSSSVSSDRDQPPAAWPRRRIWALLSNTGMTVGTVAPQALVIGRKSRPQVTGQPISVISCIIQQPYIACACSLRRWIALVPSFATIPQLASCDIRWQNGGDYKKWSVMMSCTIPTQPATYKIRDLADEPIVGSFYEQQLQKTTQTTFCIEKVLRKRKGQALMKWKGYPDKLNSCVPLKNLERL